MRSANTVWKHWPCSNPKNDRARCQLSHVSPFRQRRFGHKNTQRRRVRVSRQFVLVHRRKSWCAHVPLDEHHLLLLVVLPLKLWPTGGLPCWAPLRVPCAQKPCAMTAASSHEEEHNVWNPLLETHVKYQSGPLLLSYLEDTLSARLGLRARFALDILSLSWDEARKLRDLQPTACCLLRMAFTRSFQTAWATYAMSNFEAGTASFPSSLVAAALLEPSASRHKDRSGGISFVLLHHNIFFFKKKSCVRNDANRCKNAFG